MLVTSGPKRLIIVIVDTTAAHTLYVVGQEYLGHCVAL